MDMHETLNGLLRGELAATETYQQALAKVGDDPRAAELRRIHDEHRAAANTLRQAHPPSRREAGARLRRLGRVRQDSGSDGAVVRRRGRAEGAPRG